MMEQRGASCPPKTLTRSRCALESRPFLELPNPFLCAISHLHQNLADPDFRKVLAVALRALVLLLTLELEDQPLLAAPVGDDGAFDFTGVGPRQQIAAILKYGQRGKFHLRADIAGQFPDANRLSGGHPVLFSAGFDNRVHDNSSKNSGWSHDTRSVSGLLGLNQNSTTKARMPPRKKKGYAGRNG